MFYPFQGKASIVIMVIVVPGQAHNQMGSCADEQWEIGGIVADTGANLTAYGTEISRALNLPEGNIWLPPCYKI